MAADLIVRLFADDGSDCAWCGIDGEVGGRGELQAAAEAAAGRRVRLVVPGTRVLVTRVAVPANRRGRARAAIPWALEDRLAEDVEQLHFCLGERDPDSGEWTVAVVARRDLDRWLGACSEAGIQPAAAVPETLALLLPAEDEWVGWEGPAQLVVRTGTEAGFACEPDMLALVAGHLDPPGRIRRLGPGSAAWPEALADRLAPAEPQPDPASAFSGAPGIDLLQGDYSRRERVGRRLRRWRLPAALALALVAAVGVQIGLEYAALGGREDALRERLRATFQQTFPDVQQVSDPRAQMAARLRTLREGGGSGAGFVEVVARVGDVVSGGDRGELRGLTWRSGTLELAVAAPDLQTLDAIQRGLGDTGLATELAGVERRDERVEGRLTVEVRSQ